MTDYETSDFYKDASLHNDPHPYFDFLRNKGPVVKLPYRNVYAITGHEEAVQAYLDTEHISSANVVLGPFPDLPFEPQGDDISEQIEAHRDQFPHGREIVALDGSEHQKLRSMLMPLFTPGKLKAKDAGFRAVANQLIDEFIDDGTVELMTGYGGPFATLIITELLGLPEEDRPAFREYMRAAGVPGSLGGADDHVSNNPLVKMGMHIARYIAERRAAPRDDVLTELANAKFPDGSDPSIEQATRVAAFVFGAGQDSTATLLGNCFRIIAEHQDVQQRLRDEPGRISDFVEEVLRIEGAIKSTHRIVKRSTTIGGVHIPAGATLLLSNLAVNRDPRRFENPHSFDLDRRRNKEHLGLGRGAHTCAGAPLARLEVKISVEELLRRLGNIRIDETAHSPQNAEQFSYKETYQLRSLKNLNLRFDAKS